MHKTNTSSSKDPKLTAFLDELQLSNHLPLLEKEEVDFNVLCTLSGSFFHSVFIHLLWLYYPFLSFQIRDRSGEDRTSFRSKEEDSSSIEGHEKFDFCVLRLLNFTQCDLL